MPTASVADQLLHVILARKPVESPDSAQPNPLHAGINSKGPLMSWPCARKVLAAVCRTAVLGVVAGAAAAGDDTAAAGGLAGELQAVTRRAAPAMPAQAATFRARRPFVITMISNPSTLNLPIGSRRHVTTKTAVLRPQLEGALRGDW